MTEQKIFDSQFFKKLNTLRFSMNMRLSQGLSGIRKSSAKGSSVEFSDFREYMPGDDVRRIDWNAYGRMDRLFIKEFMEEKEAVFHIFIDTSKSMCFGEQPKSTMALRIAGALSYIILNNLDRVSVSAVKEDSLTVGKGLAGRKALQRILTELESFEFAGGTSLSQAIRSRDIRGKGVSVIISDFLDPAGIGEGVRYLKYKKQDIILIHIMAGEETDIRIEGTVDLRDMETGEKLRVTMSNTAIRNYTGRLKAFRQHMERISKKYQLQYLFVRSDEELEKVLLEGMKKFFVK